MPTIEPPSDNFEEREEFIEEPVYIRPKEWYDWFLDVPSWKHEKCGAVNFGRNKYCVYCFAKFKIKVNE